VVSEPKVEKPGKTSPGSHGDRGARERLRRVTQMVGARELDSEPGSHLRKITRMVVMEQLGLMCDMGDCWV
jgi:hypothetical protein